MSYHVFDKLLKVYGETFINTLLSELGFDEFIEETYPIELIDKCKYYKADFVGLSNNNKIINIEFQSTRVNNQDVIRFMKYAIILKEKYDKETITLIISTIEKKNREIHFKLHEGSDNILYLYVLVSLDADEIFRQIEEKVENNERLSQKDIADLSILPLFKSEYSVGEVLLKTVILTNKLKVDSESISYLKFNQDKLTEKFVKDKKLKRKIMEEIGMSMSYFEKRCYEIEEEFVNKGIEQGIEQGKEEGRKETMVEYAKSMLDKNFTKDQIMDIIGISEEELSSLLKS